MEAVREGRTHPRESVWRHEGRINITEPFLRCRSLTTRKIPTVQYEVASTTVKDTESASFWRERRRQRRRRRQRGRRGRGQLSRALHSLLVILCYFRHVSSLGSRIHLIIFLRAIPCFFMVVPSFSNKFHITVNGRRATVIDKNPSNCSRTAFHLRRLERARVVERRSKITNIVWCTCKYVFLKFAVR